MGRIAGENYRHTNAPALPFLNPVPTPFFHASSTPPSPPKSFFIPVSTLLNLLAGAWFGTALGTFVCVFCTACGSTVCYFVSKKLGSRLVVC